MKKLIKFWLALIVFYSLVLLLPAISYSKSEEIKKFESGDSLEEIREKIAQNGYNFTVDHNWVYDMSPEMKEKFFARHSPLFRRSAALPRDIGPLDRHILQEPPPDQFDWRNYNGHSYIGPIRDQGSCGSCYAFGACAAAEGTYNWAGGKYDGNCSDFSESFIIWCLGRLVEYSPHFYGCDGADYDYYELEALTAEGVCSEDDFPYTTSDPGECAHWEDRTTVFKSWHRIDCNDIEAIKTAIMTYGVVDAAVYVGSAFQAYSSGIYEDSNTSCSSSPCYYTPTNHAIALVGWDNNGDPENNGYWILRNSWGTSWGEGGYMRIKYTSAVVACEVCYLVPKWPIVTTGSATSVTPTSAILNGNVNPGGLETTYYFEYGTTTAYGSTTTETSAGSGDTEIDVNASATSITPQTTYHFRIVAANASDKSYGSDMTFATTGEPFAPGVQTGNSNVLLNTADIKGSVNPHGDTAIYYFEYGTTTAYGSTTTETSAGSGTEDLAVSASLNSLDYSSIYHYRIVAYNSHGRSYGNDMTLETPEAPVLPIVSTGPPDKVTYQSAILNGTVNPNNADGAITSFHFEYGLTEAYGNSTAEIEAGTGTDDISVSAAITGLTLQTTYHFRISGTNEAGTINGWDRTLTTGDDVLFEGFENAGNIPAGWTQEAVTSSVEWVFQNGGLHGIPASAYEGEYNACFFYEGYGEHSSRLISPEINLVSGEPLLLSFQHCMHEWIGDQDELRVYYKNSPAGSWNLIPDAVYTENVPDWTQRNLSLPEPSDIYRIAFEGIANWGHGVCVDNVYVGFAGTFPYLVSFLAGANGSISGENAQLIEPGGDCTEVTAVPGAGYHFVNWTKGGAVFSNHNPLTVTNVTSDMEITSNFALNRTITSLNEWGLIVLSFLLIGIGYILIRIIQSASV